MRRKFRSCRPPRCCDAGPAFTRCTSARLTAREAFHTSVGLDLPVRVGRYQPPRRPEEPIIVQMMRTPCRPGLAAREQHRAGRVELLTTTFDTFEQNVRDQLTRMLGAGGFDAGRDIRALTVNRWPHGYAYQYNSLWDPFWISGGPLPAVWPRDSRSGASPSPTRTPRPMPTRTRRSIRPTGRSVRCSPARDRER